MVRVAEDPVCVPCACQRREHQFAIPQIVRLRHLQGPTPDTLMHFSLLLKCVAGTPVSTRDFRERQPPLQWARITTLKSAPPRRDNELELRSQLQFLHPIFRVGGTAALLLGSTGVSAYPLHESMVVHSKMCRSTLAFLRYYLFTFYFAWKTTDRR